MPKPVVLSHVFKPGFWTLFLNAADKTPLKAGDEIFAEPLDGKTHQKVEFFFL